MTTDTKDVARFYWTEDEMQDDRVGDYVLYTDHERMVGELKEARFRWFEHAGEFLKRARAAEAALAASRSEVEGLKKYRAAFVWAIQKTVNESTYETDFIELVAKIDLRENNNV